MEQDGIEGPALLAGGAWFEPIEAGIPGRLRGLVEQELAKALGRALRPGRRHGHRRRRLTGSFGPVEIAVPRARLRGSDVDFSPEGAAGADLFRFGGQADRSDTVTDCTAAEDGLAVSAAGFGGGLLAGADLAAENRFVAGLAATEAFGQFLWDAPLGRLSYDADGTGIGAKLLIASLTPGVALTAAECRVIA